MTAEKIYKSLHFEYININFFKTLHCRVKTSLIEYHHLLLTCFYYNYLLVYIKIHKILFIQNYTTKIKPKLYLMDKNY